jgi:DNA segregation ATPase FtsK/SpoIIIE, S-DNA-T family
MLPALADGTAEVWAIDPKRMELAYGRDLLAYNPGPGAVVACLATFFHATSGVVALL